TTSYLPGPYRWPSFRCRVSCVMTNKTPTGTVRAPGFYEGTFVRERVLDLLAARLGLDPAEIRRRNLPRPSEVPYTVNTVAASVTGRDADFGGENFGAMFEQALKTGQYEARLAACRARNAAGGGALRVEPGRHHARRRRGDRPRRPRSPLLATPDRGSRRRAARGRVATRDDARRRLVRRASLRRGGRRHDGPGAARDTLHSV